MLCWSSSFVLLPNLKNSPGWIYIVNINQQIIVPEKMIELRPVFHLVSMLAQGEQSG